jgi:glycine/D-amino acid oxidase-like deaminating enzyme
VTRAIVLGAGVQGVCAALALANDGYAVTLVDEAPDCLLRTSLVNEGKIHLGHVYANDPTFETPRLMLRAAISFAPLVERFVRHPVQWSALTSTPFVYLVARDSQLTVDQLFAHYTRLDGEYQSLRREGSGRYLDTDPATLWREIAIPAKVDPDSFSAAVATPETAVNPRQLRTVLSRAVRSTPLIETLYGHCVDGVVRTAAGFLVEGGTAARAGWRRTADLVVNCLWSGRLRIDDQMGAPPRRRWVYRLKYRVLADLPDGLASQLPSLTLVLGKYGDLVTREGERSAYLSWYPACLRGWATGIDVPDAWRGPTDGNVDPGIAADVARSTLDAFGAIVPGIRAAVVRDVRAGVIVSWGATDIDDSRSELHERRDIGVRGRDGYFSIDTGKLTCAPLFAAALADSLG